MGSSHEGVLPKAWIRWLQWGQVPTFDNQEPLRELFAMARKLRVVVAGGWYHVVNRGNHRESIFRTDTDRQRFLGRLAELPERFRVEIHAFVLMDNHYHLLLRIQDANLSEAIRWLQVSYSSVFNWAHRIRGHLFQGRFRSLLIEDVQGVAEVARYLHLNPVRVRGLGLGKAEQRRARVADIEDPGTALVKERLRVLDGYPWSSWRVYAGFERRPSWLDTGLISKACGGQNPSARRVALREYTETPIRQGRLDSPWERVVEGMVLGSKEYAARVLRPADAQVAEGETGAWQARTQRPDWASIVKAAEKLGDEPWLVALTAHGNWVRDAVLFTAVRHLGYRLAEVFQEIPGLKYPAAAAAVKRFGQAQGVDAARKRFVGALRRTFGR
jgi:putative transposase